MEQNSLVKHIVMVLRIAFWTMWAVFALLLIAYELEWLPQANMMDETTTVYIFQIVVVMLTILATPMGMKIRKFVVEKKLQELPLVEAIKRYITVCVLQMSLLVVPALLALILYFNTLNSMGIFCVAMSATSALLCYPTVRQIAKDLNLNTPEQNA